MKWSLGKLLLNDGGRKLLVRILEHYRYRLEHLVDEETLKPLWSEAMKKSIWEVKFYSPDKVNDLPSPATVVHALDLAIAKVQEITGEKYSNLDVMTRDFSKFESIVKVAAQIYREDLNKILHSTGFAKLAQEDDLNELREMLDGISTQETNVAKAPAYTIA